MTPEKFLTIRFDLSSLAKAVGAHEDRVKRGLQDGRFVAGLIGVHLASLGYTQIDDESSGGGWLYEVRGGAWRLRCSNKMFHLGPHATWGTKRYPNAAAQRRELNRISGYIVCLTEHAPQFDLWLLPTEVLERWHDKNWISGTWHVKAVNLITLLHQTDLEHIDTT